MLGFDFEEYELIFSDKELWILESKEIFFSEDEIHEIRKNAKDFFDYTSEDSFLDFEERYLILDNIDRMYGDFLLDYSNNDFKTIKLVRRNLIE